MTDLTVRPAHDLGAVADLMNRYWPRPCWRYSSELLESYLQRGGGNAEWLLELRCGDELHGFMAAVPWRGRIGAEVDDAAFTSFLTVSPAAAAWGGAQRLIGAMVQALRAAGVRHYLTALEVGRGETRLIERVHARAGVELVELLPVRRWLGVPRVLAHALRGRPRPPLAQIGRTELAGCAELLAAVAVAGTIAAMPGIDALVRILVPEADPRARALVTLEDGRVTGLVLARERDVLDHRSRRNLHVDWVITEHGDPARAADLLTGFLVETMTPAIDIVVVQDPGRRLEPQLAELMFLATSQRMGLCWGALAAGVPRPEVLGAGALEIF